MQITRFVKHVLVLLPDVEMILSHGKQHRNVLFRHDMAFSENRPFCLVLYDLCHVMAEHMAHGVNRLYLFHDTSFFPVCFCVQYSVFSVKNP